MSEESTFRKYACPKLKLSRKLWDLNSSYLSLVNYVKVTNRNTFQNKIFPELNSKKHAPSPTVWFLRNWGIAQNSSCGIVQNLSFARAEKHNLQNDFCELLRKLLFLTDAHRKKNFAFRSAKVLRMETLVFAFFTLSLKKGGDWLLNDSHEKQSLTKYYMLNILFRIYKNGSI